MVLDTQYKSAPLLPPKKVRRKTETNTYREERLLPALARRHVCEILLQAREPRSLEDLRVHLRALAHRVLPNIVPQQQIRAAQERRDRRVRDRPLLANGKAFRREQRLDLLKPAEERIGAFGFHDHREEARDGFVRDDINEIAGAGAVEGGGGEELRVGVEVGDEFEEDEGFDDFGALWGGLVGGDHGPAISYCGNLRAM